ncbi:lecithin retinol acyltransferase family protein, partial [Halotia wernerae UHCC 0503]|nr:lecithin retinol acyltransferase family protein [Halotia wernerae UHCC 0503]
MRGNHVYYNCSAYNHHGIDCGDGTVIHYTKSRGEISRISWGDFASGMTVCIKEYGQCDTPDVVIWRAESRLGENTYDLFDNNCEHFATWCKTGIHTSEQVRNLTFPVKSLLQAANPHRG